MARNSAKHEGGFTPFQFEVTGDVHDGTNSVIVKVDDQRHADGIPTAMTDWWNYGGLTRDVKLIDVPETFIQDYFAQLEKGELNRIGGWVRLDGAHKRQKVTIRIPETGNYTTVDTDENGYAHFAFNADGLTNWSPENPKLLRCPRGGRIRRRSKTASASAPSKPPARRSSSTASPSSCAASRYTAKLPSGPAAFFRKADARVFAT